MVSINVLRKTFIKNEEKDLDNKVSIRHVPNNWKKR